jgi:hypothetical protein
MIGFCNHATIGQFMDQIRQISMYHNPPITMPIFQNASVPTQTFDANLV